MVEKRTANKFMDDVELKMAQMSRPRQVSIFDMRVCRILRTWSFALMFFVVSMNVAKPSFVASFKNLIDIQFIRLLYDVTLHHILEDDINLVGVRE